MTPMTSGVSSSVPLASGLTLLQFPPSAPLRPFVQCFWQLRGGATAGQAERELLHPDGGMGWWFNLGGPVERDGEPFGGRCWIDGPQLSTARLTVGGDFDLLGVRFLPGAGYAVMGEELAALVGPSMIPGDALRHLALASLQQRLREAPDLPRRIALLERRLLAAVRRGVARHPALPASLAWLQQRHGQGAIEALVAQLPIGQRRLERLFKRHVGLSPKQYARMLRIEHGRALIKRGQGRTPLTDTALEAGYCDQAHFIHDFKAVTGLTPGAYRRHVQRREGERGAAAPLGGPQP
ncbi:AraC family transcriptional regulator [Billgrantia azerbaijanica]|nr:AraC family transcriptional regulator [Halomonas azerbaijanica]